MAEQTSPSLKTRVLAALSTPATTVLIMVVLAIAVMAWGWSAVQAPASSINGAPAIHAPAPEQPEQPDPTVAEQIAEGVKAAEAKRPRSAAKAQSRTAPLAPAPAKAPAGQEAVEKSVAPVWGTTDLDRDIENFNPTSAFKGEAQ